MISDIEKDDTIIELLQNQNRQAIEDIYDKYGAALYGVVLRIVQCEKTAQEVLQQSLLQIWKNADQHEAYHGRLFNWTLQICRRTAIKTLEIKKKQALSSSISSNNFVCNSKVLFNKMSDSSIHLKKTYWN